MKGKSRNNTTRWVEEQRWSTLMTLDDELLDRTNIWHFYYFAAATIVSLLKDFRDVAEFKAVKGVYLRQLPEEYVSADDFEKMISAINLLVEYNTERDLVYEGRDIDFERGDTIIELTKALHMFVNLLPYLNDRHFNISEERYRDSLSCRHCDYNELCNLDRTIAKRIFPTLKAFAALSVFTPKYFMRMYYGYPLPNSARTDNYNFGNEWDKALKAMEESWRWILERKPMVTDDGWEDVPEKIYYGLHLFAEYLPEMQND